MYLTFPEFSQMGGSVEESTFPRLEYQARKHVDRYTQNRVKQMDEVPEAVKRCMVELIGMIAAFDPNAPALSGYSNDGYSESYAEPITAEVQERNIFNLILTYLSGEVDGNGTPLMWLGVEREKR